MYGPIKKKFAICHSPFGMVAGAVLIALAAVIVYLPVLQAGFIWDDDGMLIDNWLIKIANGLWYIWFSTQQPDYFPLTSTSFWLEWRLWGMNPLGYHITNVLLHGLGAILFWRVLLRLKAPGAWLAALIFAVHPVCVASVAWIAERKNTLSLVFFLLSVLWYLRFDSELRDTPSANRAGKWHGLSLLAFLLALLSKTSVVMLPFVLLLCTWWRRKQESRGPERLAGKAAGNRPRPLIFDPRLMLQLAPFFALALFFGLITVWFQSHRAIGEGISDGDSLGLRLLGGSWAVWFYLGKAVWPVKLSMIYPRWDVATSSLLAYVPALLWLGVLVLCWRFRRAWGAAVLFGLGCFFVLLLPVLGFFDMYFFVYSRVADHLQYPALLGVIALMVGGGSSKFQISSVKFRLCAGLGVAALSVLTWRQARVYTSAETLWRDTLAKNPRAWVAYNNLGMAVQNPAEALDCYRAALRLKPDYAPAQNNLGAALYSQGKHEEAMAHVGEAIRLQPRFADPYYNLGHASFNAGKSDEAANHFRTALRLKPNDADGHDKLGQVLIQQGQTAEAVAHFKESVRLNPDHPDAHNNLGNVSFKQGKFGDAATHYAATLRARPDSIEGHYNMGLALVALGRTAEAIAAFNATLKLRPDFARAQYQLAEVLLKQGKRTEAAQWFAAAAQNQPDFAEAHYRVGILLAEAQKAGEAINHLREAVRFKPDWVEALNQLAWILATHPDAQFRDGKQAVAYAARAVELTRTNDAVTLDTLAAAYAEAGRYDDAVATARQAFRLAGASGAQPLAEEIQARLRRFEHSQPFCEPALPRSRDLPARPK